MALRTFIPVLVVIAIQALAGCGMPKGGVAGNGDNLHASKAERAARDARLRQQVEAGRLGLAQLFPGGVMVDARNLPPRTRPSLAIIPVVVVSASAPAPRLSAPEMAPMTLASAAAAIRQDSCVYKPVMSDADMEACR
jgi:hypothetical protein